MVWMLVRAVLVLAVFALAQGLYFVGVVAWEARRTRGVRYFGLPPQDRARYRRLLRIHRWLLAPEIWFLSRGHKFTFAGASVRFRGVTAPRGSCSAAGLDAASRYRPSATDVLVVTQMKSGTTWMQQVVYELLTRGRQDLATNGRTLGSLSPWLEAVHGVPVDEAPLLGTERPSRLIKTHLPSSLCPAAPHAKYIYVVRHPASCIASCCDFLHANLQAFSPPVADVERWFCSTDMWWGAWPEHVAGWMHRVRQNANVLFVRFADMKQNLPAVIERVAAFLKLRPLGHEEHARILEHCRFGWMQQHAELFEPQPPHLFQTAPRLFVKGSLERYEDVSAARRARIVTWCRDELEQRGLAWSELYPEPALASAGTAPVLRPSAVAGPVDLERKTTDASTNALRP